MDLGRKIVELEGRLARMEASPRLSHAALDNTSIVIKDSAGADRGSIGMQPDGTLGLIAVGGPPPGAPAAPIVAASIGGLRVVWDGLLADGQALPADFDHVAVHISTTTGFIPSAATYVGTITRSGDGGVLPVIPLPYQAHYIRLVSVNTSGIGNAASTEVTATPIKVDGPDLEAGSVTAASIQAGAVQADKLEAVLQLATRIVAGDPAAARVELNEDGLRVYNAAGTLVTRFNSADGSAVFTGSITGSTITGGTLQTATSGERVTVNEAGSNMVLVYDASGVAVGELSARGLRLKGDSGALAVVDPDAVYPNLRFSNAAQSNWAYVQVGEPVTGTANLELMGGAFTDLGYTDMRHRLYLGNAALILERMRAVDPAHKAYGGRLFLDGSIFNAAYVNGDDTSQNASLSVGPNIVYTGTSRLSVSASASSNSALHVEAPTAHTGNLLRLYRDTEKFRVDKDGNTVIAGMLTAGNIASGSVNITPSAANTPTSALVTFPAMAGTTFRGFATAATTVPGTRVNAVPSGAGVTGVGTSSVTSTSMLVHVNRENTIQTTVNWMVIGA